MNDGQFSSGQNSLSRCPLPLNLWPTLTGIKTVDTICAHICVCIYIYVFQIHFSSSILIICNKYRKTEIVNIEEEAMNSNWRCGGTQQKLKGKGGVNMLKNILYSYLNILKILF